MKSEDELLNDASVVPPSGVAAAPAQPQEGMDPEMAAERGEREASPREQRMFDAMVTQSLKTLTSPQGAQALLAAAKAGGPEKALAESVGQVIEGSMQAAQAAGVQVPMSAAFAAAQPVVLVLAGIMAESGLAPDAEQTAAVAMDALKQRMAGQPGEPQ